MMNRKIIVNDVDHSRLTIHASRFTVFRGAAIAIVVAGLVMTAGCKKTEPQQATQLPNQAGKGDTGPTAQAGVPAEAQQNMQQGINYMRSHDYNSAIKEFTLAIEKYPQYDFAYSYRAVAYIEQRKFKQAEEDLNKALEIHPDNAITYYNLAALYSLQNQSDRALDSLDHALALGFKDYDFLLKDPDLKKVRQSPKFKKVFEKYKTSTKKP